MNDDGSPTLDPRAVETWLRTLHDRHDSTGYLSVSWTTPDGRLASKHFSADDITHAVDHIRHVDAAQPAGIYARITGITQVPERRGGANLSHTLPALWADIDIAGPGHKHDTTKPGALPLPADEQQARSIVTESGLPEPSLWIHSGGGLYPIWVIDPVPVITNHLEQAKALSRGWQATLNEAATRLGLHYGTEVSDLARVLRVPGTINRKEGLARPCRIISNDGPTYSSRQLRDAVAAQQPDPQPQPSPTPGWTPPASDARNAAWNNDGIKPGDDYNERATVEVVVDMLTDAGWTVDHEDNQKIYLKRPGKTDVGHSATVDRTTCGFWVFSGDAAPFRAHTDGIDKGERPFSVYAILHHGGNYSEAAQALSRRGYGTKGTRANAGRRDQGAPDNASEGGDPGRRRRAVEAAAWRTHDDIGNGQRVVDLYGDDIRHIGDEDQWAVWDKRRWAIDMNSAWIEVAKKVAESMLTEQFDIALGNPGERPEYPVDYPAIITKGKRRGQPIPPDAWLASENGTDAIAWLYATPERATWLQAYLTWMCAQGGALGLRAFAKDCRNMPRLKSMMASAQSLPQIAARRADFDRPGSSIFVTCNVTIDTRTGSVREHRPSDWNTRICPLNYRADADAPLWRKFLERNVPDEGTRRYMQKLAGYAMTGDADQKLMVLLHSDVGDTGKSLFLNVVKETLGPDYATGLAQSALAPRKEGGDGGRDPDRHAMMGKRLLIGSEFRKSEPMDEAFMKRYTGRDPISTRGNYSKMNIEWMPEGLIVIGTNKLFRIDLDDQAVWNRIVVVPFTVAFPKGHPERDEDLQRKITDTEREGVLAWMVEGLQMYRNEGLAPSGEITLATEDYRSSSDHVSKWIEIAVEEGKVRLTTDGSGSTPKALWEEFERWMRNERIVADIRFSTFKARLIELGYPYAKITAGTFKGNRVIKGIELITPSFSCWSDGDRGF